MPLSPIFLMNHTAELITGLSLGLITQISHINAKAFLSSPTAENSQKKDQKIIKQNWAEFQVASTVDYATESWFWTVFSGGQNHQVAHHLFPGMLQVYCPQITPIIKKTCAEFGLDYYEIPSFWDALRCHLGFLKVMGAAPKSQTKG